MLRSWSYYDPYIRWYFSRRPINDSDLMKNSPLHIFSDIVFKLYSIKMVILTYVKILYSFKTLMLKNSTILYVPGVSANCGQAKFLKVSPALATIHKAAE